MPMSDDDFRMTLVAFQGSTERGDTSAPERS
jgi:hypothetical protein